MKDCLRCSYCRHSFCYERFLILARLFEMQGDKKTAISFYESAVNYAPEDCEVFVALRDLRKK